MDTQSVSYIFFVILASLVLWKSAPCSASAIDDATYFKMPQIVSIVPLKYMDKLQWGRLLRKKWPPIRFLAFDLVRYEASEWTCRIIFDA